MTDPTLIEALRRIPEDGLPLSEVTDEELVGALVAQRLVQVVSGADGGRLVLKAKGRQALASAADTVEAPPMTQDTAELEPEEPEEPEADEEPDDDEADDDEDEDDEDDDEPLGPPDEPE